VRNEQNHKDEDFNLIKRDLVNSVDKLVKSNEDTQAYIKEGERQRKEIQDTLRIITTKINGDYMIYPPVLGHDQRILNLEKIEEQRATNTKNNKETAVNMATGTITIAVGGAVIWIFNVLREAFIKH